MVKNKFKYTEQYMLSFEHKHLQLLMHGENTDDAPVRQYDIFASVIHHIWKNKIDMNRFILTNIDGCYSCLADDIYIEIDNIVQNKMVEYVPGDAMSDYKHLPFPACVWNNIDMFNMHIRGCTFKIHLPKNDLDDGQLTYIPLLLRTEFSHELFNLMFDYNLHDGHNIVFERSKIHIDRIREFSKTDEFGAFLYAVLLSDEVYKLMENIPDELRGCPVNRIDLPKYMTENLSSMKRYKELRDYFVNMIMNEPLVFFRNMSNYISLPEDYIVRINYMNRMKTFIEAALNRIFGDICSSVERIYVTQDCYIYSMAPNVLENLLVNGHSSTDGTSRTICVPVLAKPDTLYGF